MSLSNVDMLVDFVAGHLMLSFMDYFSAYNHIRIDQLVAEKTTFWTPMSNLRYYHVVYTEKWLCNLSMSHDC